MHGTYFDSRVLHCICGCAHARDYIQFCFHDFLFSNEHFCLPTRERYDDNAHMLFLTNSRSCSFKRAEKRAQGTLQERSLVLEEEVSLAREMLVHYQNARGCVFDFCSLRLAVGVCVQPDHAREERTRTHQ